MVLGASHRRPHGLDRCQLFLFLLRLLDHLDGRVRCMDHALRVQRWCVPGYMGSRGLVWWNGLVYFTIRIRDALDLDAHRKWWHQRTQRIRMA